MTRIKLTDIVEFEWDEANEQKNWLKHKVTAKETEDVFYDGKRLILEDIKHSEKERRFILIGKSKKGRMLFTIFTIRDTKIRIISSRDTNRKEEGLYEKAISSAKVQK